MFTVIKQFLWNKEMTILKNQLNKTFIVILLTVSGFASANSVFLQDHAGISHAVEKFVKQQKVPLTNLQVTLTSLNKQISLVKCAKPLQVRIAPGAKLLGNTSLSVSCNSPHVWKIHVAAHIDGEINALVARRPLPRGTIIQDSDLKFVLHRHSQLNRGYYNSATYLKNMEAKRNIKAGQILTPNMVKAQKLVLRGQHITILVQKGGLNLRAKGKALMDGKEGQMIKVANLSSKKLIYAQVISEGIVKINF